jgi:hypothetical protein
MESVFMSKLYLNLDGTALPCNRAQKIYLGKLQVVHSRGINYNGYGYTDMLVTVNLAPEHWQEYEKRGMPSPTKKVDAAGAWCKRLAKLTGCTAKITNCYTILTLCNSKV